MEDDFCHAWTPVVTLILNITRYFHQLVDWSDQTLVVTVSLDIIVSTGTQFSVALVLHMEPLEQSPTTSIFSFSLIPRCSLVHMYPGLPHVNMGGATKMWKGLGVHVHVHTLALLPSPTIFQWVGMCVEIRVIYSRSSLFRMHWDRALFRLVKY